VGRDAVEALRSLLFIAFECGGFLSLVPWWCGISLVVLRSSFGGVSVAGGAACIQHVCSLASPPPVVIPACARSVVVVECALGRFLGVLAKANARSRAHDGMLSGAAYLVEGVIYSRLSSPSVVLTTCRRPARGVAAPYPVELGMCAHFLWSSCSRGRSGLTCVVASSSSGLVVV
jgi:hypothetical protein